MKIIGRRANKIEQEKIKETFEKNYIYKDLNTTIDEEKDSGKVPCKLNEKTIVWRTPDKCIKTEDGTWIPKNEKNSKLIESIEKSQPTVETKEETAKLDALNKDHIGFNVTEIY